MDLKGVTVVEEQMSVLSDEPDQVPASGQWYDGGSVPVHTVARKVWI